MTLRLKSLWGAVTLSLVLWSVIISLAGCCTSTLQPGCDPMPKFKPYRLEMMR